MRNYPRESLIGCKRQIISTSYAGHRFPAAIISHAVWLYVRFPLSLRNVDESLAARGVVVSHD